MSLETFAALAGCAASEALALRFAPLAGSATLAGLWALAFLVAGWSGQLAGRWQAGRGLCLQASFWGRRAARLQAGWWQVGRRAARLQAPLSGDTWSSRA